MAFAYFKIFPDIYLKRLKRTTKVNIQGSMQPVREPCVCGISLECCPYNCLLYKLYSLGYR
jgi:hypothetical protein